jgi:hypothetical protein
MQSRSFSALFALTLVFSPVAVSILLWVLHDLWKKDRWKKRPR